MQLRVVCPGCGGLTDARKVSQLGRYTSPTSHLITTKPDRKAIWIFCPIRDTWYVQGAFLKPEQILPEGQQLGLL